MIIRAKTFTVWMKANHCKATLADIAHHGADQGWPGLIYYTDTCKLYARFKEEIWEMLYNDADDIGCCPLEFVASFNRTYEITDFWHFENLLVWYAAERVAAKLVDEDSNE